MIRRNIAFKIGLSILGLVGIDLVSLYVSLDQLFNRILDVGGLTNSTSKYIEELLILSALGAILLAIGLAVALSKQLANPLLRMISATQDIAQGKYQTRVSVNGNDEVARLGEAFNQLAFHLNRLETTRKEFLADVAHELRTPLTYMKGYAQVLYEGLEENPDEARQYLKIIYDESQRVERLVQDLLALAEADLGNLSMYLQWLDLSQLTNQIVEHVRPKAKEKHIDLHFSKESIPMVEADPHRMKQVIMNLLDNALRYTPSGGYVSVIVDKRESWIRITVRNSGPGIPPEELSFIWDRLYRVEKSRSREYGGSGLGLSIVKQIVELHGGKVLAKSQPGVETTMSIELPIRECGYDQGGMT